MLLDIVAAGWRQACWPALTDLPSFPWRN